MSSKGPVIDFREPGGIYFSVEMEVIVTKFPSIYPGPFTLQPQPRKCPNASSSSEDAGGLVYPQ